MARRGRNGDAKRHRVRRCARGAPLDIAVPSANRPAVEARATPAPQYAGRVGAVEPFGLERIADAERHGTPRDLFALWFAANAETATFALGILTIALYGTSFRGAALGIAIGNALGYGIVGLLARAGPAYGRPQMMISRRAFGADGNVLAAVPAFLAGVGWFGINSIFGATALAFVLHLAYLPALALVVCAQIALAIYGHNMIHAFERGAGIVLSAGFITILVATLPRFHLDAAFDPHAAVAAGGEIAGIVYSAALAFSYAIGWGPCASDYSRYLPAASSRRAIWAWTFLGGALPSTALEILGAAIVTALPGARLADASPADVIYAIFGRGPIATIGLLTVTIGTVSANCLNLYSGSLSALVAWDARRRPGFAAGVGLIFGGVTAAIFVVAGTTDPGAGIGPGFVCAASAAVGLLCWLVVRYTLARWQAALAVGVIGGTLALAGLQPGRIAHDYANFLLLLSTWAAPWAGAMLAASRRSDDRRPIQIGTYAWLAGILASLPFWQQSWFTGPLAAAHPEIGDLSYFVGFVIAYAVGSLPSRSTNPARAQSERGES